MTERLGGRTGFLLTCALVSCAVAVLACSGSASDRTDAREASGTPTSARALRQGSFVSADALANTRIGGPFGTALAFRFRAARSGTVSGVRFYIVANSGGRTGYSGGTGGRLRVALVPDSGGPRHVPEGRPLASATLRTPNRRAFPLVTFSGAPRVSAGRLYHVVFSNVDPDPAENYISVNALLARERGRLQRQVPAGMAVLLGGTGDDGQPRRWHPRSDESQRYVPILDVVGSGGRHTGIGYMEVWVNNPKPIGAEAMVGQTFRAPSSTRRISGAWLRVRRTRSTSAPLQLRIDRKGTGTVASANVPARNVPTDGYGWVRARFPEPVSLPSGSEAALIAASPAGRAYDAFPIRQGTEFGFDSRTVFDAGYAMYSSEEGWLGWDQWNAHDRRDGDLQFALDTVAG